MSQRKWSLLEKREIGPRFFWLDVLFVSMTVIDKSLVHVCRSLRLVGGDEDEVEEA